MPSTEDYTPMPDEAPKRNPLPMVLAGVAAVIVLVGIGVLLFGGGDDEAASDDLSSGDAPLVEGGGPAPVDVPFEYFDGGEGTLADFEGQPVVLNFFASWCPPCITEMPTFEEVHQEVGDEVAFVGMNTQDRREDGERIVEETGVTYTVAGDVGLGMESAIGVFGMPTTVFISADGTITRQFTGPLDKAQLTQIIETDLLS